MWCDTFRELYEEIGSGDLQGPRVTKDGAEPSRDSTTQERAGKINC
jgi:hypothetical protein